MSEGYARKCRYCSLRIYMAPRNGGWVPLEPPAREGHHWNYHDCEGISQGGASRRLWDGEHEKAFSGPSTKPVLEDEDWDFPSELEVLAAAEAEEQAMAAWEEQAAAISDQSEEDALVSVPELGEEEAVEEPSLFGLGFGFHRVVDLLLLVFALFALREFILAPLGISLQ